MLPVKARWIITGISAAIFFGGGALASLEDPWFQNLKRPGWLTFEPLIPVIWLVIWVCATASAILVWEKLVRSQRSMGRVWLFMGLYFAIAFFTSAYSPVVAGLHSLPGGLIVGGTATLLVYILAGLTWPIIPKAAALLLPYMLWGPVGTYLTWVLIRIN